MGLSSNHVRRQEEAASAAEHNKQNACVKLPAEVQVLIAKYLNEDPLHRSWAVSVTNMARMKWHMSAVAGVLAAPLVPPETFATSPGHACVSAKPL